MQHTLLQLATVSTCRLITARQHNTLILTLSEKPYFCCSFSNSACSCCCAMLLSCASSSSNLHQRQNARHDPSGTGQALARAKAGEQGHLS